MPASVSRFRTLAIAGIDALLAIGGDLEIFNEVSAPFTRNTDCWAYGVRGMSAVCVDQRITLVTPEIALGVTHAFPPVDTVCTFVSEDGNNTNETRTVLSTHNLGISLDGNNGGDITVIRLSSVLPASFRPLRLAVATLTNVFPPAMEAFVDWNVPLLQTTGEDLATVTNWRNMPVETGPFAYLTNTLGTGVPFTPPRSNFYQAKAGDDSGGAMGVIVNGEIIMLGALSYATNGGTGWANWKYLDAITAAIATLGSATSLSLFDPATL